MKARFIHTADWQLGKRFGSVTDPSKLEALRSERFRAIGRLAGLAREHGVDFVVVAGDLFDSPTVSKDVISRALGAIGEIPVPVVAIPGNHDHGGAGSLWEQKHFVSERAQLAPHLTVLLEPKPHTIGNAVIFPCPLLRRHSHSNPLAWIPAELKSGSGMPDVPVRVVLAHGAIQEFGSRGEDDGEGFQPNFLELDTLDGGELDYIALGDWHGMKQAGPKAWYSGAIEPDRFPKNSDYQSGHVLLVEVDRPGSLPVVTPLRTGGISWHEIGHDFHGDSSISGFEFRLQELLGSRVQQDLVRLSLTGSVSLEVDVALDHLLETYAARLLRLDVRQRPGIQPSEDEIRDLAARPGDPLIAAVASGLRQDAITDPVAVECLRQLFSCLREVEAGGQTK